MAESLQLKSMKGYIQALKQSSQRIPTVVLRPSCLGESWEEVRKTQGSWELELEKTHLVLNPLLSMAGPSPLGSPCSAS